MRGRRDMQESSRSGRQRAIVLVLSTRSGCGRRRSDRIECHTTPCNFSGRFGGEAYAREELVAELCSAFLCAELGVRPTVRHADYLGAWLDVLKGDNRAIFQAASMASKAADCVMGRKSPC